MYLEKLLTIVGMNDNQIAIYLKCLEYGKTTASNVASALGRERTSTLKLMQHMCERGYLSQTTERNSSYFMTIPFTVLQEQFQQKQEEITIIQNNQDIILQEVQQLANPHQQDISIKIQQGLSGITYLYQTIGNIIDNQKLIHISCIADASFEQSGSHSKEIGHKTIQFMKQLQDQKITVEFFQGAGMNLMEQLSITKELAVLGELPNTNDSCQLRLVGSHIFIVIFKKNPQVLHIHSETFARLMHFVIHQLGK